MVLVPLGLVRRGRNPWLEVEAQTRAGSAPSRLTRARGVRRYARLVISFRQWVTGPVGAFRSPRWLSFLLGLGLAAVGAVLAARPFTSLSVLVAMVAVAAIVTGAAELATAPDQDAPRLAAISGVAWLVVGAAVATWPGLTLGVLTIWVGLGLILSGVTGALGGIRGTADHRITAVVSGLASIVFGVLALSWPDVTILVIAVLFGARAVLAGLVLLAAAFRRSPEAAVPPAPGPGRIRRWWRTLRAVGALIVAVALLAVSAFLHASSPSASAAGRSTSAWRRTARTRRSRRRSSSPRATRTRSSPPPRKPPMSSPNAPPAPPWTTAPTPG